jgi:hypothetical protein
LRSLSGGKVTHIGRGARGGLTPSETRLSGSQLVLQIIILDVEASKLDNDLVEKVIDLVLVVSFAKLCRLKPLVYDIFWRESHVMPSSILVWRRCGA